MDDLISRQAAITLPFTSKEDREYQTHNLDDAYELGWLDYQKCIENLPSAERHGRWIPVTDGLPEVEGRYLVCCDSKYPIEVGRFYINAEDDRWFCCDWNDPEKIIAWMPLPEPYKGGEEE